MRFLSFLAILFITNSGYAEVNKCVDAKGKITFTDAVCKKGQAATTVKINPINIANGSGDRAAIYELQQQQQDRRITYRNQSSLEKDSITKGNEERMHRMTSPLPNGLGTGKGCYKESNQVYCY